MPFPQRDLTPLDNPDQDKDRAIRKLVARLIESACPGGEEKVIPKFYVNPEEEVLKISFRPAAGAIASIASIFHALQAGKKALAEVRDLTASSISLIEGRVDFEARNHESLTAVLSSALSQITEERTEIKR